MTVVAATNIFSELGIRQGAGSGRYFVGRAQVLSELDGCWSGDTRSAAWLHGPRRSGKTSIADELIRRAEGTGTAALVVDAIDVMSFEELLQRTCDRAEDLGIQCGGADTRGRFEVLARASSRRPILLIFDEFDKVALALNVHEQAFLRRIKGEQRKLGYLFVSILDPARLVEEVSDINSRLLGVCTPVRVPPMMRSEVDELCSRVTRELNQRGAERDAEAIWDAFGGFAVAVRTALHKIVVSRYHDKDFTEEDVMAKLREVQRDVDSDLRNYWWSLQSGTRAVLMGQCEEVDVIEALRRDGLYDKRKGLTGYRYLREGAVRWSDAKASEVEAMDGNLLDSAVHLFEHAWDINEALRLRGRRIAFRGEDAAWS